MSNQLPKALDALGEIKDVLEGYTESYCELERNCESLKKEILRQQEEIERLKSNERKTNLFCAYLFATLSILFSSLVVFSIL